jgi:hypothetical protein
MDSCGNVRMDRYWNFIALPFFIITLLFGLFALFTVDEQQFASSSQIKAAVAEARAAIPAAAPTATVAT